MSFNLWAIVPIVRAPVRPEMYSDYGVSITPNFYTYEENEHKLTIDVRAMTINIEALKPIEEAVKENIPNAVTSIRGGTGYLYTPKNAEIIIKASEALEELGLKPRLVEMGGASDSRYFSPLGIQCIDFGPKGGNLHGPNEYVEVKSLYKTAEFYYKLALKLLKRHNDPH